MVISNEIFEHYRAQQKKIEKAKTLLQQNGYLIYQEISKNKKLKKE